jgi:ribosomal protein S27AE
MDEFLKQNLCPKCGDPLLTNIEERLYCVSCGYIESQEQADKRLHEAAVLRIEEESRDYKARSEFEKFAKEREERAFERQQRVKFKPGEFERTATSAESGVLLGQIKRRLQEAKERKDEKTVLELLEEEERLQHEHDRHLAHEAREREKAQRLEAKMPFELIIDSDGLVKMKFGRFPQQVVSDKRMISLLDAKIRQSSLSKTERGWFKFGNVMYAAIPATPAEKAVFDNGEIIEGAKFYYFRVDPVLWRVLDVRDDEALLLTDKVISVKDFNADQKTGKWAESYARDWLNVRFFNRAFTPEEQKWIKHERLDNKTTAHKTAKKFAGEDSQDSLFLLSHADAIKRAYGFSIVTEKRDPERRATATDYAKALGATTNADEENAAFTHWWLRSPGTTARSAACVEPNGKINLLFGVNQKLGIRAAIRIRPYIKKD